MTAHGADSQWWRQFFDDDYVAAWTAVGMFDAATQEVEGIVARLGLRPGASVLDAACGFGRVAGPLQARGFEVTGIDINPGQIALAERDYPGPRYVVGDFRQPPPGPYDAVINIFSSFGYFADDQEDLRALRAWRSVLVPGGQLLMTLTHRDRVVALDVTGSFDDEERPLREEAVTDWVRGIRHVTWTYGDVVKSAKLRLYTATELVALLRHAGFDKVTALGGLDGRPLSPATGLCVHARASTAQRQGG